MTTAPQTPRHQVLDPTLLGRPIHLLPIFAAQLRDDLEHALRLPMNRRYWGGFQVGEVRFSRAGCGDSTVRWLRVAAPAGEIGLALERSLLLSVLNFRYGRDEAAVPEDQSTVRVTATEERLAVTLARQLAGTLAHRIDLNLAAPARSPEALLKVGHRVPPTPDTWMLSVTMCNVSAGQQCQFWFVPDKDLMISVLRGLLPQQQRAKATRKNAEPLAARLHLTLTGRLMSKEVLLGSLFDLSVGDVIPISLDRTDVLLDESRLFTAAVNEHKGKLCLTCFEDAE